MLLVVIVFRFWITNRSYPRLLSANFSSKIIVYLTIRLIDSFLDEFRANPVTVIIIGT